MTAVLEKQRTPARESWAALKTVAGRELHRSGVSAASTLKTERRCT